MTATPDLPEPSDLHAGLTAAGHDLDWDDPVPTTAQLIAEFGLEATTASLSLLQQALAHHDSTTREFLQSIGVDVPHELDHRVKSPQSLARKLWKQRHTGVPVVDVLRFTVMTEAPSSLVDSVRSTVDRLIDAGWTVGSAHQSYVDGSRYKGVHAIMRTTDGIPVEVQFHSTESIEVKMRTKSLYQIERDPEQPQWRRDEATAQARDASAAMAFPAGLESLTVLGGRPVETKRYGTPVTRTARQSTDGTEERPGRTAGMAHEQTKDNGRAR
ncbi:hypothetical protein [Kribbella endophytica]